MTKTWIQVRDLPIPIVTNYATFLDHPNKIEYLSFPVEIMNHGATVDIKTMNLDGDEGLYVEEEYLLLFWVI